jgi:hypothetical protein
MEIEIFEGDQGTDEWKALRRGLPTASMFKVLMVKNDTKAGRTTYLHKLAGERITGESMENFSNEAMEDGKDKEPQLRADYAFLRDCEPRQVAFIRNGKCGASPDGLINDDGMLEIKRAAPHILIPMLLKAKEDPNYFPSIHYAQCQGGLMVSGRQWCDLLVGYPKMPRPLIVRTERNDSYIQELRNAVDVFDLELRRLVEKLK